MVKKLERTSIHLTDRQIESLEEMVRKGIYPSISEGIRSAIALLEDKHGIHGKSGMPECPATT